MYLLFLYSIVFMSKDMNKKWQIVFSLLFHSFFFVF